MRSLARIALVVCIPFSLSAQLPSWSCASADGSCARISWDTVSAVALNSSGATLYQKQGTSMETYRNVDAAYLPRVRAYLDARPGDWVKVDRYAKASEMADIQQRYLSARAFDQIGKVSVPTSATQPVHDEWVFSVRVGGGTSEVARAFAPTSVDTFIAAVNHADTPQRRPR